MATNPLLKSEAARWRAARALARMAKKASPFLLSKAHEGEILGAFSDVLKTDENTKKSFFEGLYRDSPGFWGSPEIARKRVAELLNPIFSESDIKSLDAKGLSDKLRRSRFAIGLEEFEMAEESPSGRFADEYDTVLDQWKDEYLKKQLPDTSLTAAERFANALIQRTPWMSRVDPSSAVWEFEDILKDTNIHKPLVLRRLSEEGYYKGWDPKKIEIDLKRNLGLLPKGDPVVEKTLDRWAEQFVQDPTKPVDTPEQQAKELDKKTRIDPVDPEPDSQTWKTFNTSTQKIVQEQQQEFLKTGSEIVGLQDILYRRLNPPVNKNGAKSAKELLNAVEDEYSQIPVGQTISLVLKEKIPETFLQNFPDFVQKVSEPKSLEDKYDVYKLKSEQEIEKWIKGLERQHLQRESPYYVGRRISPVSKKPDEEKVQEVKTLRSLQEQAKRNAANKYRTSQSAVIVPKGTAVTIPSAEKERIFVEEFQNLVADYYGEREARASVQNLTQKLRLQSEELLQQKNQQIMSLRQQRDSAISGKEIEAGRIPKVDPSIDQKILSLQDEIKAIQSQVEKYTKIEKLPEILPAVKMMVQGPDTQYNLTKAYEAIENKKRSLGELGKEIKRSHQKYDSMMEDLDRYVKDGRIKMSTEDGQTVVTDFDPDLKSFLTDLIQESSKISSDPKVSRFEEQSAEISRLVDQYNQISTTIQSRFPTDTRTVNAALQSISPENIAKLTEVAEIQAAKNDVIKNTIRKEAAEIKERSEERLQNIYKKVSEKVEPYYVGRPVQGGLFSKGEDAEMWASKKAIQLSNEILYALDEEDDRGAPGPLGIPMYGGSAINKAIAKTFGEKLVPFIGGLIASQENDALYQAAKTLEERGLNALTPAQRDLLVVFGSQGEYAKYTKSSLITEILHQGAAGVLEMLPYMVEFASTFGPATKAVSTVGRGVARALDRIKMGRPLQSLRIPERAIDLKGAQVLTKEGTVVPHIQSGSIVTGAGTRLPDDAILKVGEKTIPTVSQEGRLIITDPRLSSEVLADNMRKAVKGAFTAVVQTPAAMGVRTVSRITERITPFAAIEIETGAPSEKIETGEVSNILIPEQERTPVWEAIWRESLNSYSELLTEVMGGAAVSALNRAVGKRVVRDMYGSPFVVAENVGEELQKYIGGAGLSRFLPKLMTEMAWDTRMAELFKFHGFTGEFSEEVINAVANVISESAGKSEEEWVKNIENSFSPVQMGAIAMSVGVWSMLGGAGSAIKRSGIVNNDIKKAVDSHIARFNNQKHVANALAKKIWAYQGLQGDYETTIIEKGDKHYMVPVQEGDIVPDYTFEVEKVSPSSTRWNGIGVIRKDESFVFVPEGTTYLPKDIKQEIAQAAKKRPGAAEILPEYREYVEQTPEGALGFSEWREQKAKLDILEDVSMSLFDDADAVDLLYAKVQSQNPEWDFANDALLGNRSAIAVAEKKKLLRGLEVPSTPEFIDQVFSMDVKEREKQGKSISDLFHSIQQQYDAESTFVLDLSDEDPVVGDTIGEQKLLKKSFNELRRFVESHLSSLPKGYLDTEEGQVYEKLLQRVHVRLNMAENGTWDPNQGQITFVPFPAYRDFSQERGSFYDKKGRAFASMHELSHGLFNIAAPEFLSKFAEYIHTRPGLLADLMGERFFNNFSRYAERQGYDKKKGYFSTLSEVRDRLQQKMSDNPELAPAYASQIQGIDERIQSEGDIKIFVPGVFEQEAIVELFNKYFAPQANYMQNAIRLSKALPVPEKAQKVVANMLYTITSLGRRLWGGMRNNVTAQIAENFFKSGFVRPSRIASEIATATGARKSALEELKAWFDTIESQAPIQPVVKPTVPPSPPSEVQPTTPLDTPTIPKTRTDEIQEFVRRLPESFTAPTGVMDYDTEIVTIANVANPDEITYGELLNFPEMEKKAGRIRKVPPKKGMDIGKLRPFKGKPKAKVSYLGKTWYWVEEDKKAPVTWTLSENKDGSGQRKIVDPVIVAATVTPIIPSLTSEEKESLTKRARSYGFMSISHAINSVNKYLGTDYSTFAEIPEEAFTESKQKKKELSDAERSRRKAEKTSKEKVSEGQKETGRLRVRDAKGAGVGAQEAIQGRWKEGSDRLEEILLYINEYPETGLKVTKQDLDLSDEEIQVLLDSGVINKTKKGLKLSPKSEIVSHFKNRLNGLASQPDEWTVAHPAGKQVVEDLGYRYLGLNYFSADDVGVGNEKYLLYFEEPKENVSTWVVAIPVELIDDMEFIRNAIDKKISEKERDEVLKSQTDETVLYSRIEEFYEPKIRETLSRDVFGTPEGTRQYETISSIISAALEFGRRTDPERRISPPAYFKGPRRAWTEALRTATAEMEHSLIHGTGQGIELARLIEGNFPVMQASDFFSTFVDDSGYDFYKAVRALSLGAISEMEFFDIMEIYPTEIDPNDFEGLVRRFVLPRVKGIVQIGRGVESIAYVDPETNSVYKLIQHAIVPDYHDPDSQNHFGILDKIQAQNNLANSAYSEVVGYVIDSGFLVRQTLIDGLEMGYSDVSDPLTNEPKVLFQPYIWLPSLMTGVARGLDEKLYIVSDFHDQNVLFKDGSPILIDIIAGEYLPGTYEEIDIRVNEFFNSVRDIDDYVVTKGLRFVYAGSGVNMGIENDIVIFEDANGSSRIIQYPAGTPMDDIKRLLDARLDELQSEDDTIPYQSVPDAEMQDWIQHTTDSIHEFASRIGFALGEPLASLRDVEVLPENSVVSDSFKLFKKKFGEMAAKKIREHIPFVLEFPNEFVTFLTNLIPIKEDIPFIVEKMGEKIEILFRLSEDKSLFPSEDTQTENIPPELIAERAGYVFHRPASMADIVASFKKDFKDGEILCTITKYEQGVSDRSLTHFIFWLRRPYAETVLHATEVTQEYLKEDSEGSRLWREYLESHNKKNSDGTYNLTNLVPSRQDPYGTSSMSVQVHRTAGVISIKNRYNHLVSDPDATFGQDLDAISQGLKNAIFSIEGMPEPSKQQINLPDSIISDANGRLFKFDQEIENVYVSQHGYLKDGNIVPIDKNYQRMIDNYVIDAKSKEAYSIVADDIKNENYQNPMLITSITNVQFKKDQIRIEVKTGYIEFEMEQGVAKKLRSNLKEIEDSFLYYNRSIEVVELLENEIIGDGFMVRAPIQQIFLPKNQYIGDDFLFYNDHLRSVDLPSNIFIGESFLQQNKVLETFNLPKNQEIGDDFLHHNELVTRVFLPSNLKIGDGFMVQNTDIYDAQLPMNVYIGNDFLRDNEGLPKIALPSNLMVGNNFVTTNEKISVVELPVNVVIGNDFLYDNDGVKSISLPLNRIIGHNFLAQNLVLRTAELPLTQYIGNRFIALARNVRELRVPSLIAVGSEFIKYRSNLLPPVEVPVNTTVSMDSEDSPHISKVLPAVEWVSDESILAKVSNRIRDYLQEIPQYPSDLYSEVSGVLRSAVDLDRIPRYYPDNLEMQAFDRDLQVFENALLRNEPVSFTTQELIASVRLPKWLGYGFEPSLSGARMGFTKASFKHTRDTHLEGFEKENNRTDFRISRKEMLDGIAAVQNPLVVYLDSRYLKDGETRYQIVTPVRDKNGDFIVVNVNKIDKPGRPVEWVIVTVYQRDRKWADKHLKDLRYANVNLLRKPSFRQISEEMKNALVGEIKRTSPRFDPRSLRSLWELLRRFNHNIQTNVEISKIILHEDPILQSIIGETGAHGVENIMANLRKARSAEQDGKDPKTIYLATGWERGADGKWRYEIPDITLTVPVDDMLGITGTSLGAIASWDGFTTYPAAKEIPVRVGQFPASAFTGDDILLRVLDRDGNPLDEFSIQISLAHEVQHYIQAKEGFGYTLPLAPDEISAIHALQTYPEYSRIKQEFTQTYGRSPAILSEMIREIGKVGSNQIRKLAKAVTDFPRWKSLKEVEARNVETRLSMTPEERKKTLISETEDVARDQQIALRHEILKSARSVEEAINWTLPKTLDFMKPVSVLRSARQLSDDKINRLGIKDNPFLINAIESLNLVEPISKKIDKFIKEGVDKFVKMSAEIAYDKLKNDLLNGRKWVQTEFDFDRYVEEQRNVFRNGGIPPPGFNSVLQYLESLQSLQGERKKEFIATAILTSNQNRIKIYSDWIKYLDESGYPVEFKYLILNSVLPYEARMDESGKFKIFGKFAKDSNWLPVEVHPFSVGKIHDLMTSDPNLSEIPTKYLQVRYERRKTTTNYHGWVFFPSDGDSRILADAVIGKNSWCIQNSATARQYLDKGDFWVYYDELSEPQVALNVKDNEILEVRGSGKGQRIGAEFSQTLIDFVRKQDFVGGEKFIHETNLKRDLYTLDKSDIVDRETELQKIATKYGYSVELPTKPYEYRNVIKSKVDYDNGNILPMYPTLLENVGLKNRYIKELAAKSQEELAGLVFSGEWSKDDEGFYHLLIGGIGFNKAELLPKDNPLSKLKTMRATEDVRIYYDLPSLVKMNNEGRTFIYGNAQLNSLVKMNNEGHTFIYGNAQLNSLVKMNNEGHTIIYGNAQLNALVEMNNNGETPIYDDAQLNSLVKMSNKGDTSIYGNVQLNALVEINNQGETRIFGDNVQILNLKKVLHPDKLDVSKNADVRLNGEQLNPNLKTKGLQSARSIVESQGYKFIALQPGEEMGLTGYLLHYEEPDGSGRVIHLETGSDEEIKERLISETEDVARDQQIVLRNELDIPDQYFSQREPASSGFILINGNILPIERDPAAWRNRYGIDPEVLVNVLGEVPEFDALIENRDLYSAALTDYIIDIAKDPLIPQEQKEVAFEAAVATRNSLDTLVVPRPEDLDLIQNPRIDKAGNEITLNSIPDVSYRILIRTDSAVYEVAAVREFTANVPENITDPFDFEEEFFMVTSDAFTQLLQDYDLGISELYEYLESVTRRDPHALQSLIASAGESAAKKIRQDNWRVTVTPSIKIKPGSPVYNSAVDEDILSFGQPPQSYLQTNNKVGYVKNPDIDVEELLSQMMTGSNWVSSYMSEELRKNGGVSLRGRRVRNPEEFAILSRVYDDPNIETLRVFLLRKGQIVDHFGMTAYLPAASPFYFGKIEIDDILESQMTTQEKLNQIELRRSSKVVEMVDFIRAALDRVDGDQIYILHNHPHFEASMSPADWEWLNSVKDLLPEWTHNFVIGRNDVSIVDVKQGTQVLRPFMDKDSEPVGKVIQSIDDVLRFYDPTNMDRLIVIGYTADLNNYYLTGVKDIDHSRLVDGGIVDDLEMFRRSTGSTGIALMNVPRFDEEDWEISSALAELSYRDLVHSAFFKDGPMINSDWYTPEIRQEPIGYPVLFSKTDPDYEKWSKQLVSQVNRVIEVRDSEGYLVAPNGNRSRLSAWQWKVVRTPMFKEWFGDWEKNAPGLKVWLDDERPMPAGYDIWVKDANEAIKLFDTHRVEKISFDHDLGETTGYEVAKHIEKGAFEESIGKIEWEIHSANPQGRKNIRMALESAERFWKPVESSKVVDENGEPLVVYHGTPQSDFSVFTVDGVTRRGVGDLGRGFYFTRSIEDANNYTVSRSAMYNMVFGDSAPDLLTGAGIFPVFLKSENPIRDTDTITIPQAKELQRLPIGANGRESLEFLVKEGSPVTWGEFLQDLSLAASRDVTEYMVNAGVSGVIDTGMSEIVVFSPNQIKSATAGTYRDTNSILKSNPDYIIDSYIRPDYVETFVQAFTQGMTVPQAIDYVLPGYKDWSGSERQMIFRLVRDQIYKAGFINLRHLQLSAQAVMVEEVRNLDGKLLSPDGSVSALKLPHWKISRTPMFKEWFGDRSLTDKMEPTTDQVKEFAVDMGFISPVLKSEVELPTIKPPLGFGNMDVVDDSMLMLGYLSHDYKHNPSMFQNLQASFRRRQNVFDSMVALQRLQKLVAQSRPDLVDHVTTALRKATKQGSDYALMEFLDSYLVEELHYSLIKDDHKKLQSWLLNDYGEVARKHKLTEQQVHWFMYLHHAIERNRHILDINDHFGKPVYLQNPDGTYVVQDGKFMLKGRVPSENFPDGGGSGLTNREAIDGFDDYGHHVQGLKDFYHSLIVTVQDVDALTTETVTVQNYDELGMTPSKVIISVEGQGLTKEGANRMEAANVIWTKLRDTLQQMVEFGLIGQDSVDLMNQAYQWYIPLMDNDVQIFGNRRLSVRGHDIYRALGRSSKVQESLAPIMTHIESVYRRGRQNKIPLTLAKLLVSMVTGEDKIADLLVELEQGNLAWELTDLIPKKNAEGQTVGYYSGVIDDQGVQHGLMYERVNRDEQGNIVSSELVPFFTVDILPAKPVLNNRGAVELRHPSIVLADPESVISFKDRGVQHHISINSPFILQALNQLSGRLPTDYLDPYSSPKGTLFKDIVGFRHILKSVKDGQTKLFLQQMFWWSTSNVWAAMKGLTKGMGQLFTALSPYFLMYNGQRDGITGVINSYHENHTPTDEEWQEMINLGYVAAGTPKPKGLSSMDIWTDIGIDAPLLGMFGPMLPYAAIMSKAGKAVKHYIDFENGITPVIKDSDDQEYFDYMKEMREHGGFIEFYTAKDKRELRDLIEQAHDVDFGARKRASKALSAIPQLIMTGNRIVETATRVATYVAARKGGYSPDRAASLSKNITVNFNRRGLGQGYIYNIASDMWVFFNANLQGMDRFYQVLTRNGFIKGFFQRMAPYMTLGFGIAAMNRAMGGDDKDGRSKWDHLDITQKERNLFIYLGDGTYIPVKLPFGFNIPFFMGYMMEAAFTYLRTGGKQGTHPTEAFMNAFAPVVSFLDLAGINSGSAWWGFVPTGFRPMVQLSSNQAWTGATIYPSFSEYKEDVYNTYGNAGWMSDFVAHQLYNLGSGLRLKGENVLSVSPDAVNYFINAYGGGLFRSISELISFGSNVSDTKYENVTEWTNAWDAAREAPIFKSILYKHHDKFVIEELYGFQERFAKFKHRWDQGEYAEVDKKYLRSVDRHRRKVNREVHHIQEKMKKIKELRQHKATFKQIESEWESLRERIMKTNMETRQFVEKNPIPE